MSTTRSDRASRARSGKKDERRMVSGSGTYGCRSSSRWARLLPARWHLRRRSGAARRPRRGRMSRCARSAVPDRRSSGRCGTQHTATRSSRTTSSPLSVRRDGGSGFSLLPYAMPAGASASASWIWPPTPEGAVGSVASQPGRSNVKKIAGLGAHQRESTSGPFHVSSFQPLTRVRFASSESTEPPQGSDDRRASVGRVCRHGGGRHRRPALRGAAEQV